MQLRAIKTFRGRYGLVRAGAVLTLDDAYGRELLRLRLVERFSPHTAAHAEAPSVGKRSAAGRVPRPDGGEGIRSYAPRPVLRLRGKI